jgi:hypothetical protein
MADDDTRPVLPPDPLAEPAEPTAVAPAPILKTRWRDRAWSFRAMLAVALATLVLGGIAGGAIVAASDGGDGHSRFLIGPGGRMHKVPPGWRGPRRFQDGGPQWRWNDGPPAPPNVQPYQQPGPSAPAPSPLPSPSE